MKSRSQSAKRIQSLRKKIDQADRAVLRALKVRFEIAEKIGKIKIAEKMPLYQKSRWLELLEGRLKMASKMSLDDRFARALFTLIHKEALRIQKSLRRNKK